MLSIHTAPGSTPGRKRGDIQVKLLPSLSSTRCGGAVWDGWALHHLVVAVEAPGPWDVRLAVHPDLPDDALPLLQPLSSLQLLRRREDVHVQSPLEPAVPAGRQVGSGVRIVVTVAAVTVALPLPRRFFGGGTFAVRSAGHPEHQGQQCQDESNAHSGDKIQSSPLRVFWKGKGNNA